MSLRGCMRRRVILGSSAPLAAAITIGTALPVGASPAPAPASAVHAPDASPGSGVTATTPGCIVQGAVLYPLFIGLVMVLDPTATSSKLSEYWNGGKQSQGWLKACGL
jgi:hypothetical protein